MSGGGSISFARSSRLLPLPCYFLAIVESLVLLRRQEEKDEATALTKEDRLRAKSQPASTASARAHLAIDGNFLPFWMRFNR